MPYRQRKKKRRGMGCLPAVLLAASILAGAFYMSGLGGLFGALPWLNPVASPTPTPTHAPSPGSTPSPTPTPSPAPTPTPSPEPVVIDGSGLNSANALLIRLSDGAVLFEMKSDARIYPASMTKIMTALVALERLENLSASIELPERMFAPLQEAGASMAGFLPGERVRAIDLVYGVILPSGAECCAGLARAVAGSESAFVKLMNEKAQELGMRDTRFANTTGLHDSKHYSSARDMAVLLEYALRNDYLRTILTAPRRSTAATNLHPDGITFHSTLFSNLESPDFGSGRILGGKTGFTQEAGQCLASFAQAGEREYILVTAGAKVEDRTLQLHIQDALLIYSQIPGR